MTLGDSRWYFFFGGGMVLYVWNQLNKDVGFGDAYSPILRDFSSLASNPLKDMWFDQCMLTVGHAHRTYEPRPN